MGVEVLQYRPPGPVDGPVGFVDDDEVERLRWQRGVVVDGHGGVGEPTVEGGVVVVGGFAARQDAVDALDGGDDHVGAGEHPGRGELVHRVELGEAAPVV